MTDAVTLRDDILWLEPRKEGLPIIGEPQQEGLEVLLKGPDAINVEVGQRVYIGEYTGTLTRFRGRDYLMVREAHCLGVVDG